MIFTLVHGTFARGAPWVVDDLDAGRLRARLRELLERDYEVRFDVPPPWGGEGARRFLDNTIAARLKAANVLRDHLLATEKPAGARRFLVTHSHGGNVALYALRSPEARARVDGLFCLATPFLVSRPAPFDTQLLVFSALIWMVLAFAHPGWWIWVCGALYAALVVYLLVRGNTLSSKESELLADLRRKRATSSPAELDALLAEVPRSKEKLARVLEHLDRIDFPSDEELGADLGPKGLLFLRACGDEVALLFRLTRALGSFFRGLWQIVNRFGKWVLGLLLVLSLRDEAEEMLGLVVPGWVGELASAVDRWLMTPVLLVASLALVAVVIARWSTSFDAARWIPTLDTRTEPTPWPEAEATKVPIDPEARGLLRHSRIQATAAEAIARRVRKLQPAAG